MYVYNAYKYTHTNGFSQYIHIYFAPNRKVCFHCEPCYIAVVIALTSPSQLFIFIYFEFFFCFFDNCPFGAHLACIAFGETCMKTIM